MYSATHFDRGSGVSRWWCGVLAVACLVPTAVVLGTDWNPPPPNPAAPVDYIAWINQTLGSGIKDNAYDAYVGVYKEVTVLEGDWGDTLKKPWAGNKAVLDWLSANATGLEKFRQAAQKSNCFFPLQDRPPTGDVRVERSLVLVLLPTLSNHRNAIKGLLAEGYHDWQKGQHQTLSGNALIVLRAAHHLDNGPALIERLVAIFGETQGYGALRKALQLSGDPEKLAAEVLRELATVDPAPPPFSQAVRLERLFAWDLCQRTFVPGAQSGTWTLHGPMAKMLREQIAGNTGGGGAFTGSDEQTIARMGYDETLREANAYFDALEAWADAPISAVMDQIGAVRALVANSKNPFNKAILPDLVRARLLHERCTTERRATQLIVHLFADHGKTGKFPESLDELKTPDIAELRIDPFSDRDFVYRRKGNSFTLYTVAGNLKDDGGRHDPKWENSDFVFWPVQE